MAADPRRSFNRLSTMTDSAPIGSSSTSRAFRRRTYNGNINSSTVATPPEASTVNTASSRTNSNPSSTKSSRLSSRATAKKLFQQIVSSSSLNSTPTPPVEIRNPTPPKPTNIPPTLLEPQQPPTAVLSQRRPSAPNIAAPLPQRPAQRMSPTMVAIGGGNTGIPSHQLGIFNTSSPRASATSLNLSSTNLTRQNRSGSVGSVPSNGEKPVAATSGGQIAISIQLAEPFLFLQGYEPHGTQNPGSPAMLRGTLIIKFTKAAKIKGISLNFKGRARTEWPEGIPPSKTVFFEDKELMNHTWPFFNAQFASAENSHGADGVKLAGPDGVIDSRSQVQYNTSALGSLARTASPMRSSAAPTPLTDKRLSLQNNHSKSLNRSDSPNRNSVAAKGYRLFQPGEYYYNFELPIEGILPETIQCDLGSVKYELEATVERAGAFRPNLVGKKDVHLIRCPADANLEQVEPIAISRNWEDQLHYDIVISGKSFPMGAQIPIAFKLTPLAKVRCHRIKIFVTENIEYFCRNKKVHRIEPTRKIQIFEKRADGPVNGSYPGSSVRIVSGGRDGDSDNPETQPRQGNTPGDNLLGDLSGDMIGPTEMEFSVRLPGCGSKEGRIHFDTTYSNIQVHHWIKIVMRLSKVDPKDSSKRRHFEISIDSPFHILSCKCSQANIALPAYNNDRQVAPNLQSTCSCPQPRRESVTLGMPEAPDVAQVDNNAPRPMHLLRAPSFNPPAFEDDIAPPPLVTPPPQYDSIVTGRNGLADYFARLADSIADDDDTEDERLNAPRTPGGRLARSLDERRTWILPGTAI